MQEKTYNVVEKVTSVNTYLYDMDGWMDSGVTNIFINTCNNLDDALKDAQLRYNIQFNKYEKANVFTILNRDDRKILVIYQQAVDIVLYIDICIVKNHTM